MGYDIMSHTPRKQVLVSKLLQSLRSRWVLGSLHWGNQSPWRVSDVCCPLSLPNLTKRRGPRGNPPSNSQAGLEKVTLQLHRAGSPPG